MRYDAPNDGPCTRGIASSPASGSPGMHSFGLRNAGRALASWWQTFSQVRLPYAIPSIVAAQEITGSGAIIVAIAAEWMISSTGLGYVINNAMQNYRGDKVYAVPLLATGLSFLIFTFVHCLGNRLAWRAGDQRR